LSLTGLAIAIGTIVLVQHLSLKPPRTSASIRPQEKPALPLPSIPSIAVLPFTSLSGDPQQEYFSDGIGAQLIDDLSRIPRLFVIARNSSFAYKGKAIREQDVGKELGVKYLLEGTVHKANDRVRIGVELVDSGSGAEIWSARYDRPFKDIFAIQDEIVRRVATTVGLIVATNQLNAPHWWTPQTDNLEAYDDLMHAAQYSSRYTRDDNARQRWWSEKAIELDPKSADAYGSLGWTYFFDAYFQWTGDPATNIERSIEMAQKALLLDDSSCGALALLSNDYQYQREFDRAIAEGERAVTVNPNCSMAYAFLAVALNSAGKPADGLRALENAMHLDPAGHDFYSSAAGGAYILMGHYQEAIPYLQRAVAGSPNFLWAHLDLAIAYAELGRDRDAHAEAGEVMRINPSYVLPSPEKGPYSAVPYLAGNDTVLQRRFEADLRKAGLK
jgi:adenylate cyclase